MSQALLKKHQNLQRHKTLQHCNALHCTSTEQKSWSNIVKALVLLMDLGPDQTRPDQTILPIWLIQSITFCCSPQSLCSNHSMWPVSTIMVPMSRWYTSVFDGLVIFRMQTVQGCPSDGRFYWAMHQQPQVNLATCAKSVAPVNFPIDFQPVFALAWAIPGPGLWQCWWQEMGEDEG